MQTIELERIQKFLEKPALRRFVTANLEESLASIGSSRKLTNDLVACLKHPKYPAFYAKHLDELREVYDKGFFQRIVPAYFQEQIILHIPESDIVLDIGCGTGILAYELSKKRNQMRVEGCDLVPYPEWQQFGSTRVQFSAIQEREFDTYIEAINPGAATLTWTLHHMPFEQQKKYISNLHRVMREQSTLVILEDAYAESSAPEQGKERHDTFMRWSKEDRQKIMSVYDWIANRVLARREKVPIPFSYRTLEEWEHFFEKQGFAVQEKKYIGFPNKRDINTPQSLLVLERK